MIYKKLEDLAFEFKYGKMPQKEKILEKGPYPIYSGYRDVGYYKEYNLDENQLVVVARGVGGTGDVKVTSHKCWLTNLSIAVVLNSNLVNKKYVYYYFRIHNLRYLDSGSAQSQITISDLRKVKIPIPTMEIQNKIVNILEKIDKKIQINNQINDNLLNVA